MNPLSLNDAKQMPGSTLTGTDGAKIGKVADVYIDHDTQRPEWALVHTGLFGGRESFVPLTQASMDVDTVQVPYTKEQVKDAPNAEPDGELSQAEEGRLYAHYGLNYSESATDSGLPTTSLVQLTGPAGESPYSVKRGNRVSFNTAKVVANPAGFAAQVGVTAAEGAAQLTAQVQHIAVSKTAVRFGAITRS